MGVRVAPGGPAAPLLTLVCNMTTLARTTFPNAPPQTFTEASTLFIFSQEMRHKPGDLQLPEAWSGIVGQDQQNLRKQGAEQLSAWHPNERQASKGQDG